MDTMEAREVLAEAVMESLNQLGEVFVTYKGQKMTVSSVLKSLVEDEVGEAEFSDKELDDACELGRWVIDVQEEEIEVEER